ncbi:hypothetical protein ACEQ8H_001986 [Pleosporales sp. CAS-2024a]
MSGYPQVPPEVIAALARENRSPLIIGLVAGFTGLGFVCVLLRFFSRIKYVRMVGLEDYFIVISMIFSIFTSTCLIQGARYGNGRHLINVPFENGYHVLKYLFFSIIAYHTSLMLTKLSILLQYRRIFTLKGSRRPIYIVMGICTACGVTAIVTAIFTCVPVRAYWDIAQRPFAKCVNQDAMYHANAALNITTDLLVAALPVRQIWKLQIAMRQKIALLILLTLGWFVVIISVIRLYFLILVAHHPADQTWYSGPAAYWSAMETNLAIVCACTPALKPLVAHCLPMHVGSRLGASHKRATDPSEQESRGNGNGFVRLRGEQQSLGRSMGDEYGLQNGRAVTAVPDVYRGARDTWKEIHVTRDFEQMSMNEGRMSDDSRKDLYAKFPKPMAISFQTIMLRVEPPPKKQGSNTEWVEGDERHWSDDALMDDARPGRRKGIGREKRRQDDASLMNP